MKRETTKTAIWSFSSFALVGVISAVLLFFGIRNNDSEYRHEEANISKLPQNPRRDLVEKRSLELLERSDSGSIESRIQNALQKDSFQQGIGLANAFLGLRESNLREALSAFEGNGLLIDRA